MEGDNKKQAVRTTASFANVRLLLRNRECRLGVRFLSPEAVDGAVLRFILAANQPPHNVDHYALVLCCDRND